MNSIDKDKDSEYIGSKIKDLMERINENSTPSEKITQKYIAKSVLNIDAGELSKKMNGQKSFSIFELKKIANHFNVSTDYLLGLDNYSGEYPLSDFLRLMFDADKIYPFDISTRIDGFNDEPELGAIRVDPAFAERTIEYVSIDFYDSDIIEYLKAWQRYKDSFDSKPEIEKVVVEAFQREAILRTREENIQKQQDV